MQPNKGGLHREHQTGRSQPKQREDKSFPPTLRGSAHLHALEQQSHDVAAGHKRVHVDPQALSQATQKVQSHDHEVLVRSLVLVRLLAVHLELEEEQQQLGDV